MATYIKGVTDYIPVLEPFKPDYKFLSDVLTVRQDRYDTNFQSLNNLYSKVVYAPLTREDSKEKQDQYANRISNGLKQVSGLDLSLQKNVDVARGVFKPFFEDKALIKDMAFTKSYRQQMMNANRFKNSTVDETRDRYWDIGVQGLQMQMEKFRDASAEEAQTMGLPQYISNPNLYEKSFEALKDSGLKIKQTTLEGDWIVTTQNGTALTSQVTGYQRNEDGSLIYDDNKQPIPIYSNPAAEYIQNTVMQDPQVRQAYMLEAQVKAYNFGKENAEQYGGRQQAEQAWAQQTIQLYADEQTKKLVNDNAVYENAVQADNNWKEWAKRNNITPGSSAEEALALNAYNLSIAEANKKATEQSLKEVKQPTDDVNKLMNIAYSAYMGGNMAPKMLAAAKAYSMIDAERTLKANPFKQLEMQHQFALSRMNAQHAYDMAKMAKKFEYDVALKDMDNQSAAAELFSGVIPLPGDESISGEIPGLYTMMERNEAATTQQIRAYNATSKEFYEFLAQNLPAEFQGTGGYKGGGQFEYTVQNSQYPNGQVKTGTVEQMFADLSPVEITDEFVDQMYDARPSGSTLTKEDIKKQYEGFNQANLQFLDNRTNGLINFFTTNKPGDSEAPYVTLQDGSVVNLNFPTLTQTAEGVAITQQIGAYVEDLNTQQQAMIDAENEQNRIYKNIHDFTLQNELEAGNLGRYSGYKGNGNDGKPIQEIPGIILSEGEIELYKKGHSPEEVNDIMSASDYKHPMVDANGQPTYRMVSKEEYREIFTSVMNGTDADRAALERGAANNNWDMDDYSFWMRDKRGFFGDDRETKRYEYWDRGEEQQWVPNYGYSSYPVNRWDFDEAKAKMDADSLYDDFVSNMNAMGDRPEAGDMELTFDRRAYTIGQTEYGDQVLENQYSSVYDVAAPSAQATEQMKDLVNVFYNTPKADLRIDFGDVRSTPFANIEDDANARGFLESAFTDLRRGLPDKTDSRFVINDTYVERAGGPDQPADQQVAARHIRFSDEYINSRKSNLSEEDFKALQGGITIMYPESYDNNAYKSDNQLINQVAATIARDGKYESPFIANGGNFTIYQNSKGQYVQEFTTYGVDPKTGNIVPDAVSATVLNLDAKQLDRHRIVQNQRLYNLGVNNKKISDEIQGNQ